MDCFLPGNAIVPFSQQKIQSYRLKLGYDYKIVYHDERITLS